MLKNDSFFSTSTNHRFSTFDPQILTIDLDVKPSTFNHLIFEFDFIFLDLDGPTTLTSIYDPPSSTIVQTPVHSCMSHKTQLYVI